MHFWHRGPDYLTKPAVELDEGEKAKSSIQEEGFKNKTWCHFNLCHSKASKRITTNDGGSEVSTFYYSFS